MLGSKRGECLGELPGAGVARVHGLSVDRGDVDRAPDRVVGHRPAGGQRRVVRAHRGDRDPMFAREAGRATRRCEGRCGRRAGRRCRRRRTTGRGFSSSAGTAASACSASPNSATPSTATPERDAGEARARFAPRQRLERRAARGEVRGPEGGIGQQPLEDRLVHRSQCANSATASATPPTAQATRARRSPRGDSTSTAIW